MNRWTVVLGLAALTAASGAGAQLLSGLSVSGTVGASVTSSDYRYTRHIRSGSGRGGHGTVVYTWDPYLDQAINPSLAMVLNGSTGAANATGTFYAPTVTSSATGSTTVSNAASSAAITVSYAATTTLNTPQVAHQRVVTSVHGASTVYFTLTSFAAVTITSTGSTNGSLALYGHLDEGVGEIAGLVGAGASTLQLGPGSYWITSGTSAGATQDTQLNQSVNTGTTDAGFSFTVNFVQTSGDGGGSD